MTFVKYHRAVKFLESLLNLPIPDYLLKTADRSIYLKRLEWFLDFLGNPQKGFKIIHVTGTAGKGTTVNCLHEILRAAGIMTGSYYSPHPTTALERIKVNNQLISPAKFAALADALKPKLEQTIISSPFGHPSYFEAFLALAFLYFKEKKCEYVVLEAGLGGQHDATNIVKHPLVTAITNIGFDHTEILGKTLKKIAADKAGIIKKGASFFTAETRPELVKLFQKKCRELKTTCQVVKSRGQNPNRELAKAIALKLNLPWPAVAQGLKRAKLPCRSEIVQAKPTVIVDGSHNPLKLKFLANKLKRDWPGKKINVLLGLAADKNIKDSLKQIAPLADKIILTRFLMPYRKTADLKKMSVICRKIRPAAKVILRLDPWQALNDGLTVTKPSEVLVITGSFFLAGELRTHWISEEQILKNRNSF